MSKSRSSNFELMRIVSMIFIILWHIIVHGYAVENCENQALKIFLEMLLYILVVHVNSFIVVTGYFQSKSKFKLRKILKLILQVIFYCFLMFIISIKLGWVKDYNIVTFTNKILPSAVHNYWFITSYLVIYIFSDYINKFIERLTRGEYKNLIIILFLMFSVVPYITGLRVLGNTGYNFYNFIFLYMIGGYLRKYPLKETYYFKRLSKNGYRCLLIFVFFLMAFMNYLVVDFAYNVEDVSNILNEISSRILASRLAYSTPYVIIQTIAFFELFKTLNIKNKVINVLSSTVFGVYLIHEFPSVRKNIYVLLKIDDGLFFSYKMFVWIVICVLIIFIVSVLIELLRQLLFKIIAKLKPVKVLKEKFINYINSFNFKINW